MARQKRRFVRPRGPCNVKKHQRNTGVIEHLQVNPYYQENDIKSYDPNHLKSGFMSATLLSQTLDPVVYFETIHPFINHNVVLHDNYTNTDGISYCERTKMFVEKFISLGLKRCLIFRRYATVVCNLVFQTKHD